MTTTFSIKEIAWKRIFIVMALIFVPNLLIIRLEVAGPVNHLLGLATAIDLVVVLPIALYFFGFRKRAPLLLLFAFMFWGLLLANWMIPSEAKAYLSYFNYSVIALEALIITIELFVFVTILRKIPNVIRSYKEEQRTQYHFLLSFSKAITQSLTSKNAKLNKFQLLFRILATDIAAIYYSLFTWRKKPPTLNEPHAKSFTFHKDGSYLGVFFLLVHAMVIEVIAIHLIVMQFSHVLAWIVTAIDIYALLFIIADYQAIRLSPIIVDQEGLRFQKGIRQYGFIPFHDMEGIIENTKSPKEVDQDKKGISLALHGLEKEPIPYVLKLNGPVEVYHYFGKRKAIDSIYLKLDDAKQFIEYIEEKIKA